MQCNPSFTPVLKQCLLIACWTLCRAGPAHRTACFTGADSSRLMGDKGAARVSSRLGSFGCCATLCSCSACLALALRAADAVVASRL